FVVAVARRATDEGFEARALPKLLSTHRRSDRRQTHTSCLAGYEIAENEAAGMRPHDVHVDVCRSGGERVWMKAQRQAHAGFLARKGARASLRAITLRFCPGPTRFMTPIYQL